VDLIKILEDLGHRHLLILEEHGHIPGGHNGPYYDKETPVRNTAHWATTFAFLYRKTKREDYFKAVEKCADYLMSETARPMQASYYCRTNVKKDLSNGTIGQAWAIEGLVAAYKVTKQQAYLETAREVFLLHPFDERYKLWKVVNVDGSIRQFDMTFNHQLWLAASGAILLSELPDAEIKCQCQMFFDALPKMLRIYKSGLIKHGVLNNVTLIDNVRNIFDWSTYTQKSLISGKNMLYKENGYHLFNLYAFAIIKQHFGDIAVFKLDKFKQALSYCFSALLHDSLEKESRKLDINNMPKVTSDKINIYGYSYNAPGFELPYIYSVFARQLPKYDKLVESVIQNQVALSYSKESLSFKNNTEDSVTLDSRLYEFVRLLELREKVD
jgi:hypothetical protein